MLEATYSNVLDCEGAGIHTIIAYSLNSDEQFLIRSHQFCKLMRGTDIAITDKDGQPMYLCMAPGVFIREVYDDIPVEDIGEKDYAGRLQYDEAIGRIL